ncbi:hypothetical protein [Hartmannibacter diazotrophicus]|uniref:hypothetical protein n=1 Tax=Hartmannibacter diazotrophicus TaxID=1482074 RepID=UPI0012FDE81B|nr:hypothetical protein [Hartmannibacter diazotrophicus]
MTQTDADGRLFIGFSTRVNVLGPETPRQAQPDEAPRRDTYRTPSPFASALPPDCRIVRRRIV